MSRRVLVACEFSGVVRDAFAAQGWDAWSCDLLPSERPGKHIQDDALNVLAATRCLNRYTNQFPRWDLLIAHPPCTYLCNSGVRWLAPRGELNCQRHSMMRELRPVFRALFFSGSKGLHREPSNARVCQKTASRTWDSGRHPVHPTLRTWPRRNQAYLSVVARPTRVEAIQLSGRQAWPGSSRLARPRPLERAVPNASRYRKSNGRTVDPSPRMNPDLFICSECGAFVDQHGIPLNPQPDLAPKLGPVRASLCIGHRLSRPQANRLRRPPPLTARMPHNDP